MPKAAIIKNVIFPRAYLKLQKWVNFSFFFYLKFFSVYIIKKMTLIMAYTLRKSQPNF